MMTSERYQFDVTPIPRHSDRTPGKRLTAPSAVRNESERYGRSRKHQTDDCRLVNNVLCFNLISGYGYSYANVISGNMLMPQVLTSIHENYIVSYTGIQSSCFLRLLSFHNIFKSFCLLIRTRLLIGLTSTLVFQHPRNVA